MGQGESDPRRSQDPFIGSRSLHLVGEQGAGVCMSVYVQVQIGTSIQRPEANLGCCSSCYHALRWDLSLGQGAQDVMTSQPAPGPACLHHLALGLEAYVRALRGRCWVSNSGPWLAQLALCPLSHLRPTTLLLWQGTQFRRWSEANEMTQEGKAPARNMMEREN